MDEDVANVGTMNNRPKVWTIHAADFEWHNCFVAKEGMQCKLTIKVFKMLHPNVGNGAIVRKANTKHSVDWAIPIS